jgi:general secretion pathway protein C
MLLDKLASIKFPAYIFSSSEIEKRYRSFFILLAITAITYALVGIFYDIISIQILRIGSTRPVADIAVPIAVSTKQPADYYFVIPQRNLFGSTEKAVTEKKTDAATPSEGPDISLVLEVKGTMAGTGKDGFAIIEEKGKNKQTLYKVGSVVAGAKIINIARNAVTFLVSGKQRVLKMAETQEGRLLPPRPAAQPEGARSSSGPTTISRDEVSASLKDMGTMLSQAQLRPYYSEGAPDGFIITNIRPGSLYDKIGLTDGDIIQGADDRRLLTADDITALYNSLKAGSSFTLKIKRRGQQENLQYVFR